MFFVRMMGKRVGQDGEGNKYYLFRGRRFVAYKGEDDPSGVPPLWEAWLHGLCFPMLQAGSADLCLKDFSKMPLTEGLSPDKGFVKSWDASVVPPKKSAFLQRV